MKSAPTNLHKQVKIIHNASLETLPLNSVQYASLPSQTRENRENRFRPSPERTVHTPSARNPVNSIEVDPQKSVLSPLQPSQDVDV